MSRQVIVTNRRARRQYEITETLEAGLVLAGSEVKSLRQRQASLAEAYCRIRAGEAYLVDAHITPYSHATDSELDPARPRKLLLHKRQIRRLRKMVEQKGFTLIPMQMYFVGGMAKVEIGLARGKRLYDKRADIAERDARRQLERTRKQHGKTPPGT